MIPNLNMIYITGDQSESSKVKARQGVRRRRGQSAIKRNWDEAIMVVSGIGGDSESTCDLQLRFRWVANLGIKITSSDHNDRWTHYRVVHNSDHPTER